MQNAIHQVVPIHQYPINNEDQPTVDARELHFALKVGRDFSAWIQGRIRECGFKKGNDFEVYSETGENPLGGRSRSEFRISLDMAKHLCMMERNDTGHKVRQGFIDYEKQTRQLIAHIPQLPANPMDILKLHYDALVMHDTQIKALTTRTVQVEDMALEAVTDIDELKATFRIHEWQKFELKKAVDKKVSELKWDCCKSSRTLYIKVWEYIKNHFQVTSYNSIPAMRYEEAKLMIQNMTLQQIGGAK